MMKRLSVILALSLLAAACGKETLYEGSDTGDLSFTVAGEAYVSVTKASDGQDGRIVPDARWDDGEPALLWAAEEDGIRVAAGAGPETRGALKDAADAATLTFGASGYESDGTTPLTSLQDNLPVYYTTTSQYHTGVGWPAAAYGTPAPEYKFYCYSPYIAASAASVKQSDGLTLNSGFKTVSYDANGIAVGSQPDLMTAYAVSPHAPNGVGITFKHRLCAIQFKLGPGWASGYRITAISFGGVVSTGTVAIDGTWTLGTAGSYTVTGFNDVTTANSVLAGSTDTYLMMVPQVLSNATLTITMADNASHTHTLTADIKGEWKEGKTVTYTIAPQKITSLSATYPSWTNASNAAVNGPVTDYTTSDKFGLYVVDDSGSIIIANQQLGVSSVNTSTHIATLDLSPLSNTFLSSTYRYFIYYPYQTSYNASSVTAGGATPDAFFSGIISGWNPSTTQNSAAAFKAQDLQVGEWTGGSTAMAHKMGLAKLTLASKSVTKKITYTYNSTSATSATSGGNVTITATSTFNDATALRLYSNSGYWTIVKATGASANTTVTLGSSTTVADAWANVSVTGIGYGKYKEFSVSPARSYQQFEAIFNYCGAVQSVTLPWAGTYNLEVWGGEGGGVSNVPNYTNNPLAGGKGGKSTGTKAFNKSQVLYVCVGGAGGSASQNHIDVAGGYNGGGSVTKTSGDANHFCAGGGGATHIATATGVLSSLNSNRSAVLIVAGGGGGARDQANHVAAARWGPGGAGGGTSGGGLGPGTQAEGSGSGYFGRAYTTQEASSGGGGGYWGGKESNVVGGSNTQYDGQEGASGGSGYIGGVNSGSTTAGQRSGNGYARIYFQ